MKDAYPHIGGLQPTVFGETLAFEVQRRNFVQVLNVYNSHWLTISNIGSPTEESQNSLPNIFQDLLLLQTTRIWQNDLLQYMQGMVWFHKECVKGPAKVWKEKKTDWYCRVCSE